MTLTISHRQQGVTRGEAAGLSRHDFRDLDRGHGKETSHSNERIQPGLTPLNHTRVFRDGAPVTANSREEILAELDRRLEGVSGVRTNKKTGDVKPVALRKDAAVIREVILTLDPNYSRSSLAFIENQENGDGQHSAQVEKYFEDMIDFYGQVYGHENLLASSLHIDETTPHVHLWVTPITEVEGIKTVKQSAFIADGRGSNSGMAKNDRAMRQWMRERGYDADIEPRRLTTKNMTAEELQELERRQESKIELEDREIQLQQRETAFQTKVGKSNAMLKEWQEVINGIPNMKQRAVEEGKQEGRDAVAIEFQAAAEARKQAELQAAQQQRMLEQTRKRLEDLEKRANDHIKVHARRKIEDFQPPEPPVEQIKQAMALLPLRYIERLGRSEEFERFAQQTWRAEIGRFTEAFTKPRLSLADFKQQTVADRTAEEQQVKQRFAARADRPDRTITRDYGPSY